VLNANQLVRRLRANERYGPPLLLSLIIALMVLVALAAGISVRFGGQWLASATAFPGGVRLQRLVERLGSVQAAMWFLVLGQLLIAGFGGWLLHRRGRRAQLRDQREAERSQALLERLTIATQAAGVYCWELDWKTYAITWDESRLPAAEAAAASRRHFGVELGSDLFKWVHPDDQHAGGKAMTESLARGEDHVSFRYRLVLPDHSIRHVQAFARTYCDATGKPVRSLGVSWDVTQEVEAAERTARDGAKERELLERLSVATQAAGLQSWEYDFKQMKVTWLNPGAEQAELTPEAIEAAGNAMFDRFLPEDLQATLALTQAAASKHDRMLSTRCRRRDGKGSLRHVQMYQRFFYNEGGELLRSLGANLDVTDSYERQAELEALSIRFAIATRAAQAGVWEWQERNDELWWNDTMYVIYGCPSESFRPSFAALVAMIHPDDLALAQAAWSNALQESNQLHVQFRIIRPDASIVHLDSLATVVTDSRTTQRRLVGITLDISQRVDAEQRERRLQKQLREASHQSGMAEVATGVLHNVGNVLNSLGVASSTVRARLKGSQFDRVERVAAMLDAHRGSLGDFLAHDPRGKHLPEYLRALGVQLKKDAEDLQEEIDAINGHVQYLCEVVQAQQSFARLGAEETVDVRELVDTALTLKGQELNGVEVLRQIAELPLVLTDRYKLLQILVNFIANACDATAASGPGARRIAVRAQITHGQLEIAVEDWGIGIPADLLPRVWEFGFTTKPHGHGFGLHSSAVAAQQLGGTVAAHSAGRELGACFTVTIPVSDAREAVA
jgi:signal transduction histidine kinase